jgi:hypothetical protein
VEDANRRIEPIFLFPFSLLQSVRRKEGRKEGNEEMQKPPPKKGEEAPTNKFLTLSAASSIFLPKGPNTAFVSEYAFL